MKQVSATMSSKAAIASTTCSLRYTQCVKVLGPLLPQKSSFRARHGGNSGALFLASS